MTTPTNIMETMLDLQAKQLQVSQPSPQKKVCKCCGGVNFNWGRNCHACEQLVDRGRV
jgi:hypothetical protein